MYIYPVVALCVYLLFVASLFQDLFVNVSIGSIFFHHIFVYPFLGSGIFSLCFFLFICPFIIVIFHRYMSLSVLVELLVSKIHLCMCPLEVYFSKIHLFMCPLEMYFFQDAFVYVPIRSIFFPRYICLCAH